MEENTFNLAVNPSVTQGETGDFYLMFKSRKPNIGHTTHWMAISQNPLGPFTLKGPVFTDAEFAGEDPFLWYNANRHRFYAVIKDFSNSGKLSSQFEALALITSEDGITNWQPAKHPLVSLRELQFVGGAKVTLAHLERPQILLDNNGEPIVLYAAAAIKSPFSENDPVKNGKPEHNSFNVHLRLNPGK